MTEETKTEQIFEVWVDTRRTYKVPVRATDPEQAARFCEKEYEAGAPDDRYLFDESLDSVDQAEDSEDYELGEEEHDATNFEVVPR